MASSNDGCKQQGCIWSCRQFYSVIIRFVLVLSCKPSLCPKKMHPQTKGPVICHQRTFDLQVGPPLPHRPQEYGLAPVVALGRTPLLQHHNLPYSRQSVLLRQESIPPLTTGPNEDISIHVWDTNESIPVYSETEGGNSRMRQQHATQWK